jgi:hypothetical protein
MNETELDRALALLRRLHDKRMPMNIMGGCTVCRTDVKGTHRASCVWLATRNFLACHPRKNSAASRKLRKSLSRS